MDIRLEHPEFHASVADVQRAVALVSAARARASGEVALLLEGGWTGRAATSFADAWSTWLDASLALTSSLESIGSRLAAVHASHSSVDVAVAADLGRLGGRLR